MSNPFESEYVRIAPTYKAPENVVIGDTVFSGQGFLGHVTKIDSTSTGSYPSVEVSTEIGSETFYLNGRNAHHQYIYPLDSFKAGDCIWYNQFDDYAVAGVCLGIIQGCLAFIELPPADTFVRGYKIGESESFIDDKNFSSVFIKKMSVTEATEFQEEANAKLNSQEWAVRMTF